MNLETPLAQILRTTKDHLLALEGLGVRTVEDLLGVLPRSHEDCSVTHVILSAPLDERVTLHGTVSGLKTARTRTRKILVSGVFTDAEGTNAQVVWYNQPHITRIIREGEDVALTGKLVLRGRKIVFQSPTIEVIRTRLPIHSGRIVPVYPQHDIITTRWLREKMVLVREAIGLLPETLPAEIVSSEGLLGRSEAIRRLHFPERTSELEGAYERISFEEMFRIQRDALERKHMRQSDAQEKLRTPMDPELIRALFASLKFTPTNSQKIAIYEILKDMERDVPMSRLLEGDVGSGKTLVAVAVMANVLRNGGQCALMVPTEILARQHAMNVSKLLLNFHAYLRQKRRLPVIALLTGSTPRSEALSIKGKLVGGAIDIVIGTHALIEDDVRFRDLRLAIIDEQHRFGVRQRERLREKGPPNRRGRAGSPHVLAMTATPIPRTLALTAYGDHDLSVLLEKPGRRVPIHTKVVSPSDRRTIERFVEYAIGSGRQAFVICPLIQESSELAEVRNVTQEVARLTETFPRRRIAMLHGKMTTEEKKAIMQDFRDRRSDILVSTSVIEVGIDVPNATLILIEGAERFGLAQLHQLRGRVGRSDAESHCFLFATTQEQARSLRLKAMEQHDSGFILAEIDLKLRGPGELTGLRQSGLPDVATARLFSPDLVVRARRAAERMLASKTPLQPPAALLH